MLSRVLCAVSAVAALAVGAAGQTTEPDDPWPGYSPGGLHFRSIEWGVSLWGPAGADQQLESGGGVLVRYAVSGPNGRGGFGMTVLAGQTRQDLSADALLAQTGEQLGQTLGRRLTGVKAETFPPGSADRPCPLAIARRTCTVAGERNSAIHRHYLYLRLRPGQFLTIMAEGQAESAGVIAQAVDKLAASVRAGDPKQESRQLSEAAERTAKLLGELKAADWDQMARRVSPRWARLWTGGAGKPEPVGWAYAATASPAAGRIDSIQCLRTDAGYAFCRQAYIDLATGAEQVRQWTSAPGKGGPSETTVIARRQGGPGAGGASAGADTFAISLRAAGRPEKSYSVRIPGLPYLPVALQELVMQKLADQPGAAFGAFTLSADKVVFMTIQPAGRMKFQSGGESLPAVRWLIRPTVSEPMTVRLTDPGGVAVFRIDTQPDAWSQNVAEDEVPADIRRELLRMRQ